jgi:hypothetical protein
MRKLLIWFLSTRLWIKLARDYIAHLNVRVFGYPKLNQECYDTIAKIVTSATPGTMFCFVGTDKGAVSWRLNHLLTGCRWSHGGLVVLENDKIKIYHMMGNGLNVWDIRNYLKEIDHFALLRVPFKNKQAQMKAWERFEKLDATPDKIEYDFQFGIDLGTVAALDQAPKGTNTAQMKLYCSEYPFVVCSGQTSPDWVPGKVAGRSVFEPDDLYASCIKEFEA